MPGACTPPAPPLCASSLEKGSHCVCDTYFFASESRPQGELLGPLQEANFHVVDFIPVKHDQDVGFCPGSRGAVPDQEGAVLKQKTGMTVVSPGL